MLIDFQSTACMREIQTNDYSLVGALSTETLNGHCALHTLVDVAERYTPPTKNKDFLERENVLSEKRFANSAARFLLSLISYKLSPMKRCARRATQVWLLNARCEFLKGEVLIQNGNNIKGIGKTRTSRINKYN